MEKRQSIHSLSCVGQSTSPDTRTGFLIGPAIAFSLIHGVPHRKSTAIHRFAGPMLPVTSVSEPVALPLVDENGKSLTLTFGILWKDQPDKPLQTDFANGLADSGDAA